MDLEEERRRLEVARLRGELKHWEAQAYQWKRVNSIERLKVLLTGIGVAGGLLVALEAIGLLGG